jgi:septal ring factor EnvC (AmiA/AmiB activator)
MAKRREGGPAPASRKPGIRRSGPGDGNSLILRSAESLGRMIGALQRQLDALASQTTKLTAVKKRPAAARKTTKTAKTATGQTTKTRQTAKRAKTKRQG